jgi:hypothetical protein
MDHNAEDMFRTLKPAGLDTMVAEAHARRREQDLATAWDGRGSDRAVSVPAARRRMPRVLVAGLAAGAVAATAAGVIVATGDSGRSGGTRPTASGTGPSLDARSILLASAETIAKSPATTGSFWYVRERETRLYVAPADQKQMEKKFGKKIGKKTGKPPSLTAYISGTEESWDGRNAHDRTIVGIDPKITFPAPADEAQWKKLTPAERRQWDLDVYVKPTVSNYDFSHTKLARTDQEKSIKALAKLPTDAAALERVMRNWYKDENQAAIEHDGVPTGDSFPQYVFGEAQDLLAGSITPGTKAALYRLLAKQPGIHYLGTASDQLGRKGAVLAMGDPTVKVQGGLMKQGGEIRLIIDTKTGQLLAQESGPRKTPLLTMTYESMGWVNSLGARP